MIGGQKIECFLYLFLSIILIPNILMPTFLAMNILILFFYGYWGGGINITDGSRIFTILIILIKQNKYQYTLMGLKFFFFEVNYKLFKFMKYFLITIKSITGSTSY